MTKQQIHAQRAAALATTLAMLRAGAKLADKPEPAKADETISRASAPTEVPT